jgi:hypothetical protein
MWFIGVSLFRLCSVRHRARPEHACVDRPAGPVERVRPPATANYERNASLTALGPETAAKAEGLAASVLASVHAADPVAALADVLKPE